MPPCLLLSTNRSYLEATWNNRSAVSNSGCKTESWLQNRTFKNCLCPGFVYPGPIKSEAMKVGARWFWWAANKSYTSSDLCHRTVTFFFQLRTFTRSLMLKTSLNSYLLFSRNSLFFLSLPQLSELSLFPFIFCLKTSQFFPKLISFM